jgi:lipid-A-disaccharide synthase
MIIAGEASGDMHGAALAKAIFNDDSESILFGIGGDAMRTEGVRTFVDARELAVVGITEVIAKLPTIYRAMGAVKMALQELKPELLILIDFPDFNFRAAAAAKKLGVPVLYYISPQIWAWRQDRVKKIKRLVDHMAVIFPFEASFYREHQVPATFVGHPLLDRFFSMENQLPVASVDQQVIGLLPGSREKEVKTLLPIMLQAARLIGKRFQEAKFLVSRSMSVEKNLLADIVEMHASGLDIQVIEGNLDRLVKQCRLLVAASGTVTLEAALHGVPLVIVYKVSPLSYWLGKRLIKVKHIGIVNLIVEKELLPELIQDKANPAAIAEKVADLLNDKEKLNRIKNELSGVRNLLGGAGASQRVAKIAWDMISQKQ